MKPSVGSSESSYQLSHFNPSIFFFFFYTWYCIITLYWKRSIKPGFPPIRLQFCSVMVSCSKKISVMVRDALNYAR